MKSPLLKVALAAFSTALFSTAFAGIDERLDTLERNMQEISARNPQDTLGASFAPSRYEVNGTSWFISLDLIYWHTKMGGTEYAYSAHPQFSGSTLLPQVDGDLKENDFGWDTGVKVALGYKTPHDNWDVSMRYTYLNADSTSSSSKTQPSVLISLTNFEVIYASKVKSRVDITYDNLDLELARSYFMSPMLSFRPHLDVKSTWMDISQNVQITASHINNTNQTAGLDFKTKQTSKFWGVGPRAGLDTSWFLGYGFHIFANLSGSAQYAYFKTDTTQLLPPSQKPFLQNGKAMDVKHKFHRFIPSVNTYLGLGYDFFFNDNRNHIALKAGYEIQYYWRVNQFNKSDDFIVSTVNVNQTRLLFEKASEDLSFYGFTGEIRLDF